MSLRNADVERLVAPSFVEGLEDAPVSELRSRRDECMRAEVVVSYLRRVLQGELDLVRAERELRAGGQRGDPSKLVEELPAILGHGPRRERPAGEEASSGTKGNAKVSRGPGAHLSLVTIPGLGEEWSEPWEKELDEMIGGALSSELVELALPGGALPGGNLQKFSDEELAAAEGRLDENETALSAVRRRLHERIDELQAAIVARYKSGAASPDSLLR